MIFTFLYHGVNKSRFSNKLSLLEKHLFRIKQNYSIVWPGEKIKKGKINVCLTFDDAGYDFFYFIFPLLKKYQIKAVLSLPAGLIEDQVTAYPRERLKSIALFHQKKTTGISPFCSWEEIRKMLSSSLIYPASHGYKHQDLNKSQNLEEEIIKSKALIEEKLNTPINCFVYPFGRFNHNVHRMVKKYYSYVMRIGSTFNFSWQNHNGLIYRIDCDKLTSEKEPFSFLRYFSYAFSFFKNSVRGR